MANRDSSAALFIGPNNAETVVGLPFRRCKEIAVRMGVARVQCGRAKLIPVEAFFAALERQATPADAAPVDLRAELAARVGAKP